MTVEKFWSQLSQYLMLPFEEEDVEELDENCGSVGITLKDGKTFFIIIEECERCEDEILLTNV